MAILKNSTIKLQIQSPFHTIFNSIVKWLRNNLRNQWMDFCDLTVIRISDLNKIPKSIMQLNDKFALRS